MEHVKALREYAARGILLLPAACAMPAFGAAAHVHGRATLQVALDGERLSVELASPLDNLVGFEHAPRNEKQAAEVRRMAERLRQPELLFALSPEAGCTSASVRLESAVLEPGLLAEKAAPQSAPAKARKGHDEHAALSAELTYKCARPEKLTSIEAKIFEVFPRLRRLDVQVAATRKQAAASLTPRNRRISW